VDAYLLVLSGTFVVSTASQAHGGELAVWTSAVQPVDGVLVVDLSCSADAKAAPFCVHLSDLGVERQGQGKIPAWR
jgi:hypothetical protein